MKTRSIKSVLAFFLAAMMLLAAAPVGAVTAEEPTELSETSGETPEKVESLPSKGGVSAKLEQLKNQFTPGRYWNHYVSYYEDQIDVVGMWTYSYMNCVSDTPCAVHGAATWVGAYDCNCFEGNTQCWGFADRIFCGVFEQHCCNLSWRNDIQNIRQGDHIRFRSYGGDGHSAIVWSRDGDCLTLYECNATGSNCQISLGRQVDLWSSGIIGFIQATNWDEIDRKPGKPTVLVGSGEDVWVGWNRCANATYYDVRFYPGDTEDVIAKVFNVTDTYCHIHLDPGTYRVMVAAVNGNYTDCYNCSEFTSQFTVTPQYELLPTETVIWNGHMYSLYDTSLGSWEEAREFCEAHGGHLATITSSEENDVVWNLAKQSSYTLCWLGADKTSGSWKWVTGESFDYHPWSGGQPDCSGSREFYLDMFLSSGLWNDNGIVSDPPDCFVMEIDLEDVTAGETLTYRNSDYIRFDAALPWNEAEQFCEYIGGHLASVTSSGENSALKSLIQGGSGSYFIGATDSSEEGTWIWADGEQFSFTDWMANEPSNAHSVEDYVVLTANGWMATSAGRAGCAGFICEKEADHVHELEYVPAEEANCEDAGHSAYWHCTGCFRYYSDAEGNDEVDYEDLIIPALGHSFTESAVIATCVQPAGTKHTCTRCGYNYITYPEANYSDWSEEYPVGAAQALVETRTEYRYRDIVAEESSEPSVPGWTATGSRWVQSDSGSVHYVESWAPGFDRNNSYYSLYNNTPLAAYETETEKLDFTTSDYCWLFWHWCMGGVHESPGNYYISDEYTDSFWAFHCFVYNGDPSCLPSVYSDNTNPPICYQYSNAGCCQNTYWYFPTQVKSQNWVKYSKVFTYEHWGDWSEWCAEPVSSCDTREVETRTVYRYVTSGFGEHVWDDGAVTTEPTLTSEGEMTYTCTVCGAICTETIPCIAGHTVTFADWDGTVLKTETVEHGHAATAPADPTREGWTFIGWDEDFSSVTSDLTVTAQYEEITTPPVIDPDLPTVSVGTANGIPGHEVSVDVRIDGDYEMNGITLSVSWSSALLTLSEVTAGEIWNDITSRGGTVMTNEETPGTVSLMAIMPTRVERKEGVLFTVTFTIPDTVEIGAEIPLTLSVEEFFTLPSGTTPVPVEHNTVSGSVSVNFTLGDVTGDGLINAVDALIVMRYALQLTALTPNQVFLADISGDGQVNAVDALIIMRTALGLI